ncbi:MAG: hypothetical protein Q7S78_02240 [Candidatus Azambacteria bacterium]|nr:hypothetical protein [Candidatus Azambacteria bacterium]
MWYSSKSRISVVLVVLALSFAAITIAGCGDENEPAAGGATATATSATGGKSGATGDPETSETGPVDTPADDGGVSPQGDDGGVGTEGGAGDEEPARAPIEMTVAGKRFGPETSDEVHVPAFMAIELDVTVRDSADKKLLITRSDGKSFSRTFPGGKRSTYLLEGLRTGRSLIVSIGSDSVTVVADVVEVGP